MLRFFLIPLHTTQGTNYNSKSLSFVSHVSFADIFSKIWTLSFKTRVFKGRTMVTHLQEVFEWAEKLSSVGLHFRRKYHCHHISSKSE